MIRVVIVDDQQLMRVGLTAMLESQPDIQVIGEAADGQEGITVIGELKPDVVLMDIRMPGTDGLAATAEVMKQPDPPRVIVLTTFGDETYVHRALSAGAVGFLLKDTPPQDLIGAVRKAHEGLAVLDPTVTRMVIQHFTESGGGVHRAESLERLKVLTGRELEVLACLGAGMSNADIGIRLSLTQPTVKSHVSRVMEKLQCANRTQAAIVAYEAGLVD